MGRKTARKTPQRMPASTPGEVPTAPSAASLVAVLVFLAIVVGGGWFVFDRFKQQSSPTEARSLAPVPPYPTSST